MGLDVSYYASIKFVRKLREDEEYFDRDEADMPDARHFTHVDFEKQADGLDGIYTVEGAASFRVGSYSYYGFWRGQLANMIGEVASDIWERARGGAEGPFYDLINFADNEGVIGPKTCDKLARTFDEWRDRAQEYGNNKAEERDFFATYEEFRTAFKAAAGHGCVDFH